MVTNWAKYDILIIDVNMKKEKNVNIKQEIDELYKKLKIDVKQAEKNLKYYTQNDTLNLNNGSNYNINIINSIESKQNEL